MAGRRSLLDTGRQDRLQIDAIGHRAVTTALQHGLKEEEGPHSVPHVRSTAAGKCFKGEIHTMTSRVRVAVEQGSRLPWQRC